MTIGARAGLPPGFATAPHRSRPGRLERDGVPREGPPQLSVHRHQPGAEVHSERDELAVVRRTVAVAHELEHSRGIDLVLVAREKALGLCLDVPRRRETSGKPRAYPETHLN